MILDRTPGGDTRPCATAPALPAPEASAFPDALVQTPHWVGYAWEVRGEGRTKIPKNPHSRPGDKENASSTDPATWADFATARDFALRQGYGLGFMLAPPFVGIDLDHCRDAATGALSTLGVSVLSNLDTYAEVSVSGTGVKAIAYGEKPGRRCKKHGLELEIYSEKRLFALTGQRLDDAPLQINDCQDAITHSYTAAFGQTDPTPSTPPPAFVTTDDDRAVLDWLTTYRPKFAPLWAGDTDAYNGDRSAADQALCNMLAFRTGDENRVDSLYRQSGLYRPKWERGDYRHRTITKAMQQRRFFTPPTGPTLSSVDSPALDDTTGDCAARLALLQHALDAERQALAAEREHRKAVHALLTNEGMTPVERVIAYGLVFAVQSAASRDEHADGDPEARPVNCSAIAENVGLRPQTVSANIRRFAGRGQLRMVTSPKATRDGKTYREIAVHLPGRTALENLRSAASWTRPEGTPHVGGNGRRCPQCDSTTTKKAIETKTVETTTLSCADCGHVHTQTQRIIGKPTTAYSFSDDTTPPMLDLAAMRGTRPLSSVDSLPRPEAADTAAATLSSVDSSPIGETRASICAPATGVLSSVDSPLRPEADNLTRIVAEEARRRMLAGQTIGGKTAGRGRPKTDDSSVATLPQGLGGGHKTRTQVAEAVAATLSTLDSPPLSPHDTHKTVERPCIIPRYPPAAAGLSTLDSPALAPAVERTRATVKELPVASWDGTHPCRDCGQTCYAPAGAVPRCLPCARGRPADPWGDVAAGGACYG